MALRAVAFDFDGVLVDSNPLKRGAYFRVFEDVEGAAPVIERSLEGAAGKHRFQNIETILRALGRDGDLADEVNRRAQAYNRIVTQGAIDAKPIPGAVESLDVLGRDLPLYVISNTIEDSLLEVVKGRGWEKCFKRVLGTPKSKIENFRAILDAEGCKPEEVLVVGDSSIDLGLAQHYAAPFYAVVNEFNDFAGRDLPKGRDLTGLTAFVKGAGKLHLGAGNEILEGWVNHDIAELPGIDAVFDLAKTPWPLADASFSQIRMRNVLEHLPDTVGTVEELWRVLKPGGTVEIRVPYWNCYQAVADPTHVKQFHQRTFDFFDPSTPDGAERPYYSKAKFDVVAVRYWFPLWPFGKERGWIRVSNPLLKGPLTLLSHFLPNIVWVLEFELRARKG